MADAIEGFRGTIIKVPGNEPGLILANGKQWPFGMEGVWVSPVAPAANQTVEVTLDAEGHVARVSVVDAQQVAREKFNQFAGVAGEHGQQVAAVAKANFAVVAARMGYPLLIAAVVLWVAWFFMTSLQINMGSYSLHSFSFYELCGLSLNSQGVDSHTGFWSLLGVLCIVAPWAAPWLRQRWASLLNLAPLVFVVLTWARYKWAIHSMINEAVEQAKGFAGMLGSSGNGGFEKLVKNIAEQTAENIAKAVSTGFGLWLVVLSALVLAVFGYLGYRSQSAASSHAG